MIEAVEETEERNHRASKPEPVVVTELPVIFINLWSYGLFTREYWGQHCQVTAMITSKHFSNKRLCTLYIYIYIYICVCVCVCVCSLRFKTDCVFCSQSTVTVTWWWLTLLIRRCRYIRTCTYKRQLHSVSHWVCVMWSHKNLWITVRRTECSAIQCSVCRHSGSVANNAACEKIGAYIAKLLPWKYFQDGALICFLHLIYFFLTFYSLICFLCFLSPLFFLFYLFTTSILCLFLCSNLTPDGVIAIFHCHILPAAIWPSFRLTL